MFFILNYKEMFLYIHNHNPLSTLRLIVFYHADKIYLYTIKTILPAWGICK